MSHNISIFMIRHYLQICLVVTFEALLITFSNDLADSTRNILHYQIVLQGMWICTT